jgi:hypothetical protein
MGNRALLRANFARLNDQGVPLLCSRKEASEWYATRAALSVFKRDRVGEYDITTAFRWFEPDTPLFWEVRLFETSERRSVGYRFGPRRPRWRFTRVWSTEKSRSRKLRLMNMIRTRPTGGRGEANND